MLLFIVFVSSLKDLILLLVLKHLHHGTWVYDLIADMLPRHYLPLDQLKPWKILTRIRAYIDDIRRMYTAKANADTENVHVINEPPSSLASSRLCTIIQ